VFRTELTCLLSSVSHLNLLPPASSDSSTGGYITQHSGSWRWCYYVGAILVAITWLVMLLSFPETLYHRDILPENRKPVTWLDLMTFRGIQRTRRLQLRDFGHVFYMLKYPSVLLPTIYYSLSFGFGSVLFAVTGSAAFNGIYKFNTINVGLCIGLSTFLGTLIGEAAAGPVSDRLLYLYRKRHGGEIKPEARLHTIWPGTFLLPIGVAIEGACLQYKTHFMGPVMGIAIAAFGLQIVSTTVFAYVTDVSSLLHCLAD